MEEAARLRQDRGVTVRVPIPCQREVAEWRRTSKRLSSTRYCRSAQGPATEKLTISIDSKQLPQDVTWKGLSDDTQSVPVDLCYSNCHFAKSHESSLVRSRLSPNRSATGLHNAMLRLRCGSLFILFAFLFLLQAASTTNAQEARSPLVRVTGESTFLPSHFHNHAL